MLESYSMNVLDWISSNCRFAQGLPLTSSVEWVHAQCKFAVKPFLKWRQKIPIDWNEVANLIDEGMLQDPMADFLEISRETLRGRMASERPDLLEKVRGNVLKFRKPYRPIPIKINWKTIEDMIWAGKTINEISRELSVGGNEGDADRIYKALFKGFSKIKRDPARSDIARKHEQNIIERRIRLRHQQEQMASQYQGQMLGLYKPVDWFMLEDALSKGFEWNKIASGLGVQPNKLYERAMRWYQKNPTMLGLIEKAKSKSLPKASEKGGYDVPAMPIEKVRSIPEGSRFEGVPSQREPQPEVQPVMV